MVQESFSGFCKRTATLPSDDSRILEQSFEHSRISFWNRGRSNQYRRFNYVTFAAGRMITAKGLSAGRHIFLETTYQVRFETLAYPLRAFPSSARFKRWYAYAPASPVCPPPRSRSSSAYPGSESGYHFKPGTAKCPESLCPTSALPPLGRRAPPPRRALPLRLCSYGLMRQTLWLSPPSA